MRLKSDTRKTPEIERAAGKDQSRPVLTHAYLNVEHGTLETCDSYKAAVVPVEIEEGDESGLIPTEALKAQRKASKYSPASLSVNGDVRLKSPDGEQSWRKGEGQFPNLESLTPTEFSSFKIGLNPKFLLELAQALGDAEAVTLEFTLQNDKTEGDGVGHFPSNLRPYKVTVPNGGDSYGILMPRRLS